MNILLPSDVFPPGSVGGAAWSAHTLANALQTHGHHVTAVVPTQRSLWSRHIPRIQYESVEGVPTVRWHYSAPSIPIIRNYYRHELLWQPFARLLTHLAHDHSLPTVIHAQHVQTTPAAIIAARQIGSPAITTIRDHWPWDYFATGLHGNRIPCPCSDALRLMTDLPHRLGIFPGMMAILAIPSMIAHMRRRTGYLAQADAVIAVSHYIAERLAYYVPDERIHVIPNMVNMTDIDRRAAPAPSMPLPERFVLFVGKLERNKIGDLMTEILQALATSPSLPPLNLVIAGNGTLRSQIERQCQELQHTSHVPLTIHFLSWVPHDEVLRIMARCQVLLFPSVWGEPLSRVLLEACALGVPIIAMPTGGTADILTDGVNGILARTPQHLAYHLLSLLRDAAERQRLGQCARHTATERFSVQAVLPRIESLYHHLLLRPTR